MRVVAGKLRGRALRGRAGLATRPTTERARAGLFDWIGARIAGAEVLDLYAGVGSLGIEALSRGAQRATFVESQRGALATLRTNLAELGLLEASRVLARDARRALGVLRREGARFDVAFADPPYGARREDALLAGRVLAELLAPGGLLVIERARRVPALEPGGPLRPCASRAYGETRFDWYEPAEESQP